MRNNELVDTRDRLLQVASTLMWERSYQAAGVDELCQRANAKKGSFYHHFSSKTDLAIAAIERSWAQTEAQIFKPVFNDSRSGLQQLRALIQHIYEFQLALAAEKGGFLGCPFGALGQEMARQDERLRVALQKIFDAHRGYFEGALARAEQAGEIPPGDNRKRAAALFSLLQGALLGAKVANDPLLFLRAMDAAEAVAAA